MPDVANIAIHASQFPQAVKRDLMASLRSRQVNHKFHYDSVKQTQKWLALHQACSPSRNDPDCAQTYDRAFAEAAQQVEAKRIHLIGLGCGGGQKDTGLLRRLRERGRELWYTPSDVSVAMVLVAREAALAVAAEENCFPFVCDLAGADDLSEVFEKHGPADAARLVTFFGMIPNFEPQMILPKLARLVRRGDLLLLSANLAPGADYDAGVRRVLPQYDNALTRDWLLAFLLDLGVERGDGEMQFLAEDDPAGSGLKRVIADFHFSRDRRIAVGEESFDFHAGESIRLFFSYRHTPELVRSLLAPHGLQVRQQWITNSGEEGVFLIRRR
jgi:uncharacterized SAM-dependent methyltransferase